MDANTAALNLMQKWVGSDDKITDMSAFYDALVRALEEAHSGGKKSHVPRNGANLRPVNKPSLRPTRRLTLRSETRATSRTGTHLFYLGSMLVLFGIRISLL